MPFSRTRATDARPSHSLLMPALMAVALLCSYGAPVRADDRQQHGKGPAYQTVVVDTLADNRPREDEASSASVITSNRTPRTGEDLPQLLSELPGTDIVRYGGAGALATISLRASTPNQVQVYVDDVPVNVSTGGGVDLSFLPLAQLDRVEVYRGVTPLQFGTSGIGGVVSLRTRMPGEDSASLQSGFGSFGARSIAGRLSLSGKRVRALGSLQAFAWDGDYPFTNDKALGLTPGASFVDSRTNNDLSQYDGNVKLVVPWGERTFTASLLANRRHQGFPGSAHNANDTRLSMNRVLAQIAFQSRGDMGVGSRIHANLYSVATDHQLSDIFGQLYSGRAETLDQYRTWGGAVRTHWVLHQTRLRTLLEVTHQLFEPFDAYKRQPAGAPGSRTSVTAGTEADFWIRSLNLAVLPSIRLEAARDVVSLRERFTDIPQASPPELHVLPVARLALVQRPHEHVKLHANAGRYVRLPSTTERYGNTGFLQPNPDLEPERGLNVDVGAQYARKIFGHTLLLDTAIFSNRVDDLIVYTPTGPSSTTAINVGKATILGAELAAHLQLGKYVHLAAQGTFTDARDRSKDEAHRGRRLPLRAPWRFFFRPELRDLRLSPRTTAGVYSDVNFATGSYLDPNNAVAIPTRWLLGAGCHIRRESLGLSLLASAYNLANVRAMDQVGFPLPGRSFFLSIAWDMTFAGTPTSS